MIEYEALPYIPYFIEKLFLKNKNYILNFDDNIWSNYENKLLLRNKLDSLVENASGVIVANSFLEEKVSKLNNNIIKIPTVIDIDDYENNNIIKFDKFTLVWIGSPSTYKYITSHSHIFKKLSKIIDYKLVIIASKDLIDEAIVGVNMDFYDWSTKNEVKILKKSHIGIMPLDADTFAQGKSSFKIIQYMAAGLPTIASSIGENCNVLENNKTGFLVDDEESWIDSIQKLYDDKKMYDDFAMKAKSNAYEYSIQKYFKEFNLFINKTFKEKN
ncbi:glycosyl transferase, group 1 [Sulfurimonas gotlandica GD1]|uniref:Glycosyl transferase, group 1 n=1 Tax=Sulfurimonas gotlandica (strain DSM 19862 / JCM 16533 / GD1) TaxID=929558 RepID=H1FV90_SULGG|nr:glycosyl transferase, group 1 [Sulfurimonas gotlandica GD1]